MSGGDWKSMFKAVQDGDYELVKCYLRLGIDINYQHPEYMALPLVESIRYNHIEIAKLLLENGAKPDTKEFAEGETPLSVAKDKNNNTAIVLINKYLNSDS
jgi:ankyrin repeat protein